MSGFRFHNPVKAICGDGALQELERSSTGHRVLLVTGASSAKANGSYDSVRDVLAQAGAEVIDLAGVTQCTYERIAQGCDIARQHHADMVVGLGGASVMDTAKAIAFCAVHDDYDIYLEGELEQRNDEKLPLVLMPTYPSTGSEANGVSDIMGYSGGINGIYADYALLCPSFTCSLSKKDTAYSTMVMLAQTGYRYFTDANAVSRRFTAASLISVLEAFEAILADPEDLHARETMLWASFIETSGLLGLEMQDSWTYSIFSAAGLLRFSMGTLYRQNLAMMLPRWLVFAARNHPKEVRDFAVNVMGAPVDSGVKDAVRHAYDRLMWILECGGLPRTLYELGDVPEDEDIEQAVAKVSSREFTTAEYVALVNACKTERFPSL